MEGMTIKETFDSAKEVFKNTDDFKSFDPDQRLSDIKDDIKTEIETKEEKFDPDQRISEQEEFLNSDDQDKENGDNKKEKNDSLEDTYYYTTEKERIDKTPSENSEFGTYLGERGNSKFVPTDQTEEGRKARIKLAEHGQDGVEYKNGEPDFSKCSEANVKIDNMTVNRHDYRDENGIMREGNFTQADKKCAELWTKEGKVKEDGTTQWTEKDVYKWRHDNKCTWHECCDRKSMNLLSRDIHGSGKFTHSGGCAECKIRDSKEVGGIFDE